MAGRRPARPAANEGPVIDLADEQLAAILNLRVTAQTEIGVGLHQHLAMRRSVRLMAGDAPVSQRLVFKDKTPRLLPVTGRALLVEPGHGQPAGWLHYVRPMRIVTLNTRHSPLDDRMMLGQVEIGVDVDVAVETGLWTSARIENGPLPAQRNVPAARAVTRLATNGCRLVHAGPRRTFVQS
jgi:hypothetical protein